METSHDDQHGGPLHPPRELPAPPDPFAPGTAIAELAHDLLARRLIRSVPDLGAGLSRRFDLSGAPGLHAAQLGQRFVTRSLRNEPLDLTVSPYAPPQRQISTARQGAPMWSPPASRAVEPELPGLTSSVAERPAPARATAKEPSELPADLRALLDLHRARGNI